MGLEPQTLVVTPTVAHTDLPEGLEKRIDETVEGLRELCRGATLRLTLEIGKLVIDKLHGGDVTAWRDRGRHDGSIRQLAQRDDLPISASALYRSLAIYELSERLGGVSTWKHLGISHLRAVLACGDTDQRRLLTEAEDGCWTVAELEARAREAELPKRGRGGRRRLPCCVKAVRRMARLADGPRGLTADLDQLTAMNEEQRSELQDCVDTLIRSLSELKVKLAEGVEGSVG